MQGNVELYEKFSSNLVNVQILPAGEFRMCLCLQSRQTHKRFWIKQNQTKLPTYFSFHLCEEKLSNGFITTLQTKTKMLQKQLSKSGELYFVVKFAPKIKCAIFCGTTIGKLDVRLPSSNYEETHRATSFTIFHFLHFCSIFSIFATCPNRKRGKKHEWLLQESTLNSQLMRLREA